MPGGREAIMKTKATIIIKVGLTKLAQLKQQNLYRKNKLMFNKYILQRHWGFGRSRCVRFQLTRRSSYFLSEKWIPISWRQKDN